MASSLDGQGSSAANSDPREGTAQHLTFVGRARELAALRAAFDGAVRGHGRMVLVTGEAGIGKTWLCDELTKHAEARGARVLWGRCWEGGGAPAYWPWVQALRAYVRDHEPERLIAKLGKAAEDLAPIIPEIAARLPDTARGDSQSADDPRFRVFDSATELLRNIAAERPLLIVVDDLQAADESSLLLLQFVARSLRAMRVLIVATQREPHAGGDAGVLLGDLSRESDGIRLCGLSSAEIETLIRSTCAAKRVAATRARMQEWAIAIHAVTAGNSFFVDAVLRLLVADDRIVSGELPADGRLPIPHEIRAAIGRRLRTLSAASSDLLAVASVLGREFDLRIVARVRPSVELHDLLAEARSAGIVTPAGAPSLYGFSHALIRDTLYEGLAPTQTAVLHRAVAQGMEHLDGDDPDCFSAIAHHYLRAAAGAVEPAMKATDLEKAVAYATRAGDRATALLAYKEGAYCYRRAIQALDLAEPQPLRRCELLLASGEAYRKAGDSDHSRADFLQAADLGRRLLAQGEPQAAALLARAALGIGTKGFWGPTAAGEVDDVLVALLEECLAALGPQDSVLRAQALGCLAMSLYWSPNRWPAIADLSAEAVAIAQRLGDPVTQLLTLASDHVVGWTPDNSVERRAAADHLLQLAQQVGHRELNLFAYAVHLAEVLALGELERARSDAAAFARLAEDLKQPHYLWWLAGFRTTFALLSGRLELAEQLAGETLAFGQQVRPSDAAQVFGVQQFTIRRERGGLDDLLLMTEGISEQHRAIPAWRCGFALLLAEVGRSAEAQQELDRLAVDDFGAVRRDLSWLVSICLLAETAGLLRDLPRAATLYRLLQPYAERVAVIGYGYACWGSLSRYLGLLAATTTRWPEAAEHFERAVEINQRLRARLCLARTQVDYAEMLRQRAATGDRERAEVLLAEALRIARECNASRLEERALRLRAHDAVAPRSSSGREPESRFMLEGDCWTIAFEGGTWHLKDMKGLRYIHHLLVHPEVDFHVLGLVDLTQRRDQTEAPRPRTDGFGRITSDSDAGEILDARARSEYRQRLVDLREELSEARDHDDLGRQERLQTEIDLISQQLFAACGLGQQRRAGSYAERARLSVAKAIGGAQGKIRECDPRLGRYLANTVRTGTFCSYTPDPNRPILWLL